MKLPYLPFKSKFAAIALALFIVLNALFCAFYLSTAKAPIDTNLLALFPKNAFASLDGDVTKAFVKKLDKQVVLLVKDNGDNEGKTGKFLVNELLKLNIFSSINGLIDENDQKEYGAFFFKYKLALIDKSIVNMLEHDSLDSSNNSFINFLQTQIYNGFAGLGALEIQNDPYLLTRSKQMALLSNNSKISLKNNLLSVFDGKDTWYFIYASLKDNGLDVKSSKTIVESINNIESMLYANFENTKLLRRGSVFYNYDAQMKAEYDIKKLATLSIVLMLSLMLIAFKSIMPIIFTLFSVGIGAIVGVTLTTLLFSSIHLITILISISIVGIAADYSIFYLAYAYSFGSNEFEKKYYSLIKKSIFIALLTSALAYILMLIAPFPIITQISLLAITGLLTTALVVLIFYPFLNSLYKKPKSLLITYFKMPRLKKSHLYILSIGVFAFCAIYIPRLNIDHDISKLQALNLDLKEQDTLINTLTGQNVEQKFILVQGLDANEALLHTKKIYALLHTMVENKILDSYQELPINTLQEQEKASMLIDKSFLKVQSFYKELGLDIFNVYKDSPKLYVEQYFNEPVSAGFNLLFIKSENKSYIMIPLTNIHDIDNLKRGLKDFDYAYFIDRKSDFNELFASCSNLLFIILLSSLAIIALSYLIRSRFNLKHSLLCFMPSLLSVAMSYAILAFLNMPLNMFAILASLLVLGISVNYVSFIKTLSKSSQDIALFAVAMAMLTTIITLGILVFSSTYAVAVFGIVLTTGIITAFIFCPLAHNDLKKGEL